MNNLKNKNKYKELYLPQILSSLKKEIKESWIKWSEEIGCVDSIQFELVYKGRYMQCAICVYEPYEIQYRIVGNRYYKKCLPYQFISEVKNLLLH